MPYVVTSERKGTEEKERLEKEYDAAKSIKKEKAIDGIWERLGELKEIHGIEERREKKHN